MKNIKNNKGAMFYTLIGVMVIVMVAVVVLHIMRTTYSPNTADNIQTRKFSNALNNLEATMQPIARYSEYPALWKVGHNVKEDGPDKGVNVYLTLGDEGAGRAALKKDLTEEFAENFNQYLKSMSETNNSERYTIRSDGIPFIVEKSTGGKINVTESSNGMKFTIPLHIESQYGDMRYENNVEIVSETPTRIFDMYERSWKFHENYERNVQWATTIALYTRAYLNGYNPLYNGSYLREGHIAYDPIDTILRGDLKAFKNFGVESITDIGSVPLATWLTEWQYLGEPSFVPTGVDFDQSKEGNAKIIDSIISNYDINASVACETLSGGNRTECEEFNNPDEIQKKIDQLTTNRNRLKVLADKIEAWTPDKKMTCDAFKLEANVLIDSAIDEFAGDAAQDKIVKPSVEYSNGTELSGDISKNKGVINILQKAYENLTTIMDIRLPPLGSDLCFLSDDGGCRDESCPSSEDGDCDNPKCNVYPKIMCPVCNGGVDCFCKEYVSDYYDETVDCETKNEDGSTDTWQDDVEVPLCNCQCHPDSYLIKDTTTSLGVIHDKINPMLDALDEQISELTNRRNALVEAQNKLEEIHNTVEKSVSTGYDVVSVIDFSRVQYDDGISEKCYLDPTWVERSNGTCGNKVESTGLYTGQISAAVVCCSLTGSCCSVVKYASEWFPVIYKSEGDYVISESLVDDRNRIMPHNVFAGDDDLYGLNVTPKLFNHVAPEFVIYKEYSINVEPQTGERVLVYLYLPKIVQTQGVSEALKKVLTSFTDGTCTRQSC